MVIASVTGSLAQRAFTGVSAESNFNAGRNATNAINGNGLIDLGGGAFGHSVAPEPNMWLTENNQTGSITFDAGGNYTIDALRVWNYNEILTGRPELLQRGVATGNISVASSVSGPYTPVLNSQAFTIAPGVETADFSQSINLGGVAGRFVRIDVLSNHGDSFTGLSEVQFAGTFMAGPAGSTPLSVAGVTASSNINDNTGFDRLADYTIDGSGLFGDAFHSTAPEPNMWLGISGDTAPDITWDLGSVQPLSHMKVWNYNEAANATCCLGRGINDTDIYISDDGSNFALLKNFDFAVAPGLGDVDFSERVDLGASARFVRFDILSNHGDGSFTGMSEVQFFAVPEPSVAGLALLGALGLLARRRR